MNKSDLNAAFDGMTPAADRREAMKARLLQAAAGNGGAARSPRGFRRRTWFALPAACVAVALTLLTLFPLGGNGMAFSVSAFDSETKTAFRLADNRSVPEDYGSAVVNVDPRPSLDFSIEGKNIAKIEFSCENEYLLLPNAEDWSADWSVEYGGETASQVSSAPDHPYDRSFIFLPNGASDRQFVTLRWEALRLFDWAIENDFSHIKGADIQPTEDMSEQDKLALAAGQAEPGVGHIQLAGYSPELLEDRITVTLTDLEGAEVTKIIRVSLSNNDSGETVVTAGVENP